MRGSYQNRDPSGVTFEAGNALTNMPILDSRLDTGSIVGGWTKILKSTMVNEFRTGYNNDNSKRQSNFKAAEVAANLGLENAPSKADAFGFPSFQFVAGTNRPTNIVDAGRNVDRTLKQNAFSISNNLTWIKGGHSLKVGGLYSRNMARDGFGIGVNNRGLYRFNAAGGGNAFVNFLLGRPVDARDQVTARGPLDGYSNDFAVFGQDDWRVNKSLTVFLGLRYEVVGTWHEDSGLLANFILDDGGHHVVPSAEVAAKLPPGLIALNRTLLASEAGLPDTLLNADKNNFSPRVGFAWRLDESNKTVLRGGFGLFHPTVAVQGIRDLLATNEFRYTTAWSGGGLRNAFSGGEPFTDPAAFGNQGIDPNLEAPDIYRYNLTIERELGGAMGLRVSYIGSTSRKLLNDVDFNTLPASTVPFINDGNPEDAARLPYFPMAPTWTSWATAPRAGTTACSWSSSAGGRAALRSTRPTRWPIPTATRPTRATARSGRSSSTRTTSRRMRARSKRHQTPVRGKCDLGRPRGEGAQARRRHVGVVQRAVWRMDRVDNRAGPQRTEPHAVLQQLLHDHSLEYRQAARRPGQLLLLRLAAGPDQGSQQWWNARCVLRPDRLCDPGRRQARERKEGSLKGPGTWVANFGFYKDIIATSGGVHVQFSTIMDNAFNHPQFFPGYGTASFNSTTSCSTAIRTTGQQECWGPRPSPTPKDFRQDASYD